MEVKKIAKRFINDIENTNSTQHRNTFKSLNIFKDMITEFEIKNNKIDY